MFNQATIMGFLGNDPAIHTFQSGSKSATFTVAVNKSYIDRQGHKQTITTWINCVAYNKMADIVAQMAKKGSLVFVQGELQQNKPYTNKDGVMVQSCSIIVDTIRLLGGEQRSGSSSNSNSSNAHPYPNNPNTTNNHEVQHQPPVVEDINPEDIPF